MRKTIYNASGKDIGYIEHTLHSITICNKTKPTLVIDDTQLIASITSKNPDNEVIKKLYDEYYLTIGEIAAIYDVVYCNINRKLNEIGASTGPHENRRNAAFGKTFSEEKKKNMSKGVRTFYNKGGKAKPYERTPEIRAKISKGLRKAYDEGRLADLSKIARDAWKKGKYDKVDFKRGIGGWMTSKKTGKRFFFRSLLELCFALQLENDNSVCTYDYEPFIINCDNGTCYTPDFLINGKKVVELKAKSFVYKQGGIIQEKFEYKCKQMQMYCDTHNLEFAVVYDEDIGFDSAKYKRFLRKSDCIKEYDIVFQNKERVWSKK